MPETLPLPYEQLEGEIGYSFKDKHVIETALTHSSYTNEQKARGVVACDDH